MLFAGGNRRITWSELRPLRPRRPSMPADRLTITDDRTGKRYDVPISHETIRATELHQIASNGDGGLMTYDPGYVNTASCVSGITFIDGAQGILNYRGYPIEELAEQCGYLEVAHLLVCGELPTEAQLADWTR